MGCGALLMAAAAPAQEARELGEPVSIIRLVANPDAYDGKVVFVTGYLTVGLENNSLCLSREPASSHDCLWVELDDGPWESKADERRFLNRQKEWLTYSQQRVSIRATLDKTNTGHFGGWSAGLAKISEVYGARCQTEFAGTLIRRVCSHAQKPSPKR